MNLSRGVWIGKKFRPMLQWSTTPTITVTPAYRATVETRRVAEVHTGEGHGPTINQSYWEMLAFVLRRGGAKVTDVAMMTAMSPGQVSKVMARGVPDG